MSETDASITPSTAAEAVQETPAAVPAPNEGGGITVDQVKLALRRVKDPELNLNIVDLGLVYDIRIDGSKVAVDMSLTSPACPSGPELIGGTEEALRSVEGVEEGTVNLVWQPFWTPDRIEPRVRAYLGL